MGGVHRLAMGVAIVVVFVVLVDDIVRITNENPAGRVRVSADGGGRGWYCDRKPAPNRNSDCGACAAGQDSTDDPAINVRGVVGLGAVGDVGTMQGVGENRLGRSVIRWRRGLR